MKYIKTKNQGVQNFTLMSKIRQGLLSDSKYLWAINLILLVTVVFLGIEQAGRGATISNLENKIEEQIVLKRNLSEAIFSSGSSLVSVENAENSGFIKPSNVHYFKTENIFAKLPVQ